MKTFDEMLKTNINCISLSVVKSPKCLILRYHDKQSLKYRKRIIPIRQTVTEATIDQISGQLVDRHKPYLETISRKNITELLRRLVETTADKQSTINRSADELSFGEDDEEFVF